jgi:hypothetical protein
MILIKDIKKMIDENKFDDLIKILDNATEAILNQLQLSSTDSSDYSDSVKTVMMASEQFRTVALEYVKNYVARADYLIKDYMDKNNDLEESANQIDYLIKDYTDQANDTNNKINNSYNKTIDYYKLSGYLHELIKNQHPAPLYWKKNFTREIFSLLSFNILIDDIDYDRSNDLWNTGAFIRFDTIGLCKDKTSDSERDLLFRRFIVNYQLPDDIMKILLNTHKDVTNYSTMCPQIISIFWTECSCTREQKCVHEQPFETKAKKIDIDRSILKKQIFLHLAKISTNADSGQINFKKCQRAVTLISKLGYYVRNGMDILTPVKCFAFNNKILSDENTLLEFMESLRKNMDEIEHNNVILCYLLINSITNKLVEVFNTNIDNTAIVDPVINLAHRVPDDEYIIFVSFDPNIHRQMVVPFRDICTLFNMSMIQS